VPPRTDDQLNAYGKICRAAEGPYLRATRLETRASSSTVRPNGSDGGSSGLPDFKILA